jgi:hypothetical protein
MTFPLNMTSSHYFVVEKRNFQVFRSDEKRRKP